MAPLLRASFFRCFRLFSSIQPELRTHQLPESHCVVRRLYGGNAAMEESQPTNNIAGAATTEGDIATDEAERCGSSKKGKLEGVAADRSSAHESDTDKITRLILDKMKSKNVTDGKPSQKELPPMKPKGSEEISVNDDKWAQVLSSMQKMAAKNRANLTASGGEACHGDGKSNVMKSHGENDDVFADLDDKSVSEDDFTDLDSPQGYCQSGPAKGMPQRPSTDPFCMSNKQKKGSSQDQFNKQKSWSLLSSSDAKQKDVGFGVSGNTIPKDTKPTKAMQVVDSLRQPVSFNFPTPEESKGASSGLEREDLSRISSNTPAAPRLSGFTACVENLPAHCNLALVKEALSIHGEIISSFKKDNQDKTCSTYIEFKLADSLDSALASGFLQIDSKAFSILRADLSMTTVVRLSKVSGETNQLLAICSTFGGVDNIRRRGNGVYDVFYRVDELPNMARILNNLSAVTLNQRRLVVLSAPCLHPAARKDVLRSSEGHAWHASQVSQLLNQIERCLDTVSVSFEDLKALTAMEDEIVPL